MTFSARRPLSGNSLRRCTTAFPRRCSPHLLGRSQEGQLRLLCYPAGGTSSSGPRMGPENTGGWRRIAIDKLSQVEL